MNIRYQKIDLTLNGNEISGNTFPVKDFIKSKLDGQWNAMRKVWIVNVDKVNYWIEKGAITANNSDAPARITARPDGFKIRNGMDGWCDKCHSYCFGDCDAH